MKKWILVAALAAVGCSSAPEKADDMTEEANGHAHHKEHKHGHEEGHMGFHKKFDNPEAYVDRWNDPARDEWQKPKEILAQAGFEEGMTVADIGTGTGYFVPHLSEAVGPTGKVYALDIEQAMVDYTTKASQEKGLTNVEVRKIGFDGPGTDDGEVDRFIVVNTWHHINNRLEYSKTLMKATKPGGAVVIVDFKMDSPMGPPKDHRLAPDKVIEELTSAGFQAELLPLELPRQYVVVGTRP